MKQLSVVVFVAACHPAPIPSPATPATTATSACAPALPALAKQHTPNNSKLYVASLAADGTIGTPALVTAKPGYVNQPAFAADGNGVYFTWRPDGSQADIWFRDLRSNDEHAITCSSEEEYVASPTPDHRLSVIRVEPDLARRLVVLGRDGKPQQTLFADVTTVGAYRWVDAHTVVMLVGNPDGSTKIVLGDVTTGKLDTIADQTAAALAVIPGTRAISYVDASGDHMTLRSFDLDTHATAPLLALPDGVDTVAWLADGSVLAGTGTKIVRASVASPAWRDVVDLAGKLAGPITRVVVSDDHRQLAIVVHVD